MTKHVLNGTRVQASKREGVGLKFPERDPDHEDPEWFQRDLDGDDYKGLDEPDIDPLPTLRHRTIPS